MRRLPNGNRRNFYPRDRIALDALLSFFLTLGPRRRRTSGRRRHPWRLFARGGRPCRFWWRRRSALFDPGFGFDPAGVFRGSRAALEVRAHDVPFMVENGQSVCKLTFERMLEEPTALYGTGIGSSYQQQEETLSRYFRRTQD